MLDNGRHFLIYLHVDIDVAGFDRNNQRIGQLAQPAIAALAVAPPALDRDHADSVLEQQIRRGPGPYIMMERAAPRVRRPDCEAIVLIQIIALVILITSKLVDPRNRLLGRLIDPLEEELKFRRRIAVRLLAGRTRGVGLDEIG
jgi:hypothetical protein